MKITDEWRMFDPEDERTHPEGISNIEIEVEDGGSVRGSYSRDLGIFTAMGHGLNGREIKRWRYFEFNHDSN